MLISFLSWLKEQPRFLVYLILGAVAFLEYLIPPIPGDLVILFGVSLAVQAGFQIMPVMFAAVFGSVLGLALTYFAGHWFAGHPWSQSLLWPKQKWWFSMSQKALSLLRRYGVILLIFNRFLPAVRAVIFFAAGLARLGFLRVFLAGIAGSVIWNGLLAVAGFFVGSNFEKVVDLLSVYQNWAAVILILVVAVVILVRRRTKDPQT